MLFGNSLKSPFLQVNFSAMIERSLLVYRNEACLYLSSALEDILDAARLCEASSPTTI